MTITFELANTLGESYAVSLGAGHGAEAARVAEHGNGAMLAAIFTYPHVFARPAEMG